MGSAARNQGSAVLLGVVAALLLLASPAAAEVRTGQGTSPADGAIPGEADILSGDASYDSGTGAVTITFTTREAPGSSGVTSVGGSLGVQSSFCAYPAMTLASLSSAPNALWFMVESEAELVRLDEEEKLVGEPAGKSVSGTTTTFSVTSGRLVGMPYNCAEIAIQGIVGEEIVVLDELTFPIAAATAPSNPGPPPTPAPPAPPIPPAPPAPLPAALAIGASKPVRAMPGKWTKVKVQIADPGGAATGPVQLRVKAPAGVKLKPGSGKVSAAALQPGRAETVTFEVEPTRKAKAKSTLALTATAGGLSAQGSAVVKSVR